jgi:hypothetical protein
MRKIYIYIYIENKLLSPVVANHMWVAATPSTCSRRITIQAYPGMHAKETEFNGELHGIGKLWVAYGHCRLCKVACVVPQGFLVHAACGSHESPAWTHAKTKAVIIH